MIAPSSDIGKRLNLMQDSYFSLDPVAALDHSPPSPFPLACEQELILHRDYHTFGSKLLVFPKYKGWKQLVAKFTPLYAEAWKQMYIYDFIMLTCHEIRISRSVLAAALNFWSDRCNSLILPLGPMSITLRDVVALTGLPIWGCEIPSRIRTDAFSHMKVPKVKDVGEYQSMINTMLSIEEVTLEDHVNFLWLLLCQFIFEPLTGRGKLDVLMIAKALASGRVIALAPMLLANTYQRISLTISEGPLAKVRGGMWLLQLWLFAYFPHLATDQLDVSRGSMGVDLCYSYSDMELSEVIRRFRQLVPGSLNLFIFDKPGSSFLPPWATNYFATTNSVEAQCWYFFVETKHLFHGFSRNRNNTALSRGMVLYAPCLWARQFGFYQAIPGALPFLSFGQQHDANDDEISMSAVQFRKGLGPVILDLDQPTFLSWWEPIFHACVPTPESSGSSAPATSRGKNKIKDIIPANGDAKSKGKTKVDPQEGTDTDVDITGFSKQETDPSENLFLTFNDDDEADTSRKVKQNIDTWNPAPYSEFPSLDYSLDSSSKEALPKQPAARAFLPTASSLDLIISPPQSQQSTPAVTKLESVKLKIDNPFDKFDFAFSSNRSINLMLASEDDSMKAAQDAIVELFTTPPSVWTSEQVRHARQCFDVLMDSDRDAIKAEIFRNSRSMVVETQQAYGKANELASSFMDRVTTKVPDFDVYKGRYNMVIGSKDKDEQRLKELEKDKKRLIELERETFLVRSRIDANLIAGAEFRQSLPKMELDLQLEKQRLMDQYKEMQSWHHQSEKYRQEAAKICSEWMKNSQVHLSMLFP